MKKKAKKEYKWLHKRGSSLPGYSNGVKVTVHKNGHKYKGTAYAVKNSYGIRCEVRGSCKGRIHIKLGRLLPLDNILSHFIFSTFFK